MKPLETFCDKHAEYSNAKTDKVYLVTTLRERIYNVPQKERNNFTFANNFWGTYMYEPSYEPSKQISFQC
jgi:hypothetical protein